MQFSLLLRPTLKAPLGRGWLGRGSRSFRHRWRLGTRTRTPQFYFATATISNEIGDEEATKVEDSSGSISEGFFSPSRVIAKSGEVSNRWAMAVPAFAAHLCIGSPYAWSALSDALSREFGFVCAAASDWSMAEVTVPLSIVFALQGISAALAGTWQMKVGARSAMTVAAGCFGGGLMIGALGIHFHSLALLYLGYGFLGGCGVGIGYTPPLQALLEWFPDKKGMASGLCIAGFGSGALVFAPAVSTLMTQFASKPTFVGSADVVSPVTEEGRFFADVGGQLQEV